MTATDRPSRPPRPVRARRWVREHRVATAALGLAFVAILVGALALRAYFASYVATDDAQVDGHIAAIGARVAGTVLAVHVEENQPVRRGDLLVELDPRDLQVALARAQADLALAKANLMAENPRLGIAQQSQATQVATSEDEVAAARAQVAGAERDLASAKARVAQAEANATRARTDAARAANLLREQAISQQEGDQRRAEARAAAAELESARELARAAAHVVEQQQTRVETATARQREAATNAPRNISAEGASLAARAAAVEAAQAALERARLDVEYARIVAPFDGIVGRRAVEPGQHVAPGEQLVALVDVNDLWITANYKETQLEDVQPGQAASVDVDAFGARYRGRVDSLGAASGARFSLLPPENATGNYVKVVQRVPVRIRLDPGQAGLERLRPGMSAEPRIWVK